MTYRNRFVLLPLIALGLLVAFAGCDGGGGDSGYFPGREDPGYGAYDSYGGPEAPWRSDVSGGGAADYYAPPWSYDGAMAPSHDASSYWPTEPDEPEPPPVSPDIPVEPEVPATNPFVEAAFDPQSTFGADVDTASYDIFRYKVQQGFLPQPAFVRLEEFVNFFDYDYPVPAAEGDVPFSLTLSAAQNPFRAATFLLRVAIRGRDIPASERRPANLVFLVDASGSMAGPDRIGLVQTILRETMNVLAPTDTVSIVKYSNEAVVLLPPTPVAEASHIRQTIDALDASGSTAGAAGLRLAYEQARAGYIEGGVNHVLLCTDGDFNVGISRTADLLAYIEEERRSGVTLTVLGFGWGNLNDHMMETVSNAGNGTYAYIGDHDRAVEYVHQQMLSSMFFIAKDMKIQVEFNADHVYAYRLLGYENRAIANQDFTDDRVDGGEVGANHRVTALYEIVPVGTPIPLADGAPPPEAGDPATVELDVAGDEACLVKIRYKDVDATEEDAAYQVSAALPAADLDGELDGGDDDLRWAIGVAGLAEILKGSPYGPPAIFPTVRELLQGSAGEATYRRELVGWLDSIESWLQ
jgi:Ca-activated chloride channel homolog